MALLCTTDKMIQDKGIHIRDLDIIQILQATDAQAISAHSARINIHKPCGSLPLAPTKWQPPSLCAYVYCRLVCTAGVLVPHLTHRLSCIHCSHQHTNNMLTTPTTNSVCQTLKPSMLCAYHNTAPTKPFPVHLQPTGLVLYQGPSWGYVHIPPGGMPLWAAPTAPTAPTDATAEQ